MKFFLLRLIAELKAFQVTLELMLGSLGLFQVTSELNELLVLFVFQRIAVSSQIVGVSSELSASALMLIKVATQLANQLTVTLIIRS